jgi:hypothetical protein
MLVKKAIFQRMGSRGKGKMGCIRCRSAPPEVYLIFECKSIKKSAATDLLLVTPQSAVL